jgi:hypothetical protein
VPGGVDIAMVCADVSSRCQRKSSSQPGFVPAIHVLTSDLDAKKDVDARHKAGHEGEKRT